MVWYYSRGIRDLCSDVPIGGYQFGRFALKPKRLSRSAQGFNRMLTFRLARPVQSFFDPADNPVNGSKFADRTSPLGSISSQGQVGELGSGAKLKDNLAV
jgi:hypothetical protein